MDANLPVVLAAAVASTTAGDCNEVATGLRKASETANAEGNNQLAEQLDVIAQVLGMLLVPSSIREPYRPMVAFQDRRSAMPEDFDDGQLALMVDLLASVQDADVAARIADVLWIRRRDIQYARLAIAHYLAYATQREDFTHWTDCAERLERSLRLAAQIRRGNPEPFDTVVAHMLQLLERGDGRDPLFLSCRMMELLYQFEAGDVARCMELSESYAKAGQVAKEFHRAEAYWLVNERWARRTRDDKLIQTARIGLAESYALHAETIASANGSALTSAHWLEKSVEAYKNVAGEAARREELYALLRTYQKAALAEFKPIGGEFDISDVVRQSLEAVSGKSLEESLFTLAFRVIRPPDYEKMTEQARLHFRQFPLSNLFSGIQLDAEARIVARRAAGLAGEPDEREVAEWQETLRIAMMQHNVLVQGVIDPIRMTLCTFHNILERDLLPYCLSNPFIADGQEALYARGLYAGLTGDFASAIALLVPLLENSLRHVLKQKGVETTSLNAHGIQEEMHLASILDHERCKQTLGENPVKDLRALLIERTYGNLRNRVAHGLMSTGEFFQPAPIYLWWLCLRYVLHVQFHARNGSDAAPKAT